MPNLTGPDLSTGSWGAPQELTVRPRTWQGPWTELRISTRDVIPLSRGYAAGEAQLCCL
jgi:hypothetical protein